MYFSYGVENDIITQIHNVANMSLCICMSGLSGVMHYNIVHESQAGLLQIESYRGEPPQCLIRHTKEEAECLTGQVNIFCL